MRILILAMVMFIVVLQSNAKELAGIKITGTVKNSNQEYIVLSDMPHLRGNLNFDGFRSIGNRIDKSGKFYLHSSNITHVSVYSFTINMGGFSLILFNGDSLNLEFDLKDIDGSLFAKGRGAGKINLLRLPQFQNNLGFKPTYTMASYKVHVDSVISSQLNLLESIYNKDLKNDLVLKASNEEAIERIIKESPLSEMEYKFLVKEISFQKSSLTSFPSYLCDQKLADSALVNFNNPYFKCFNEVEYKSIDNIHYWRFEEYLDAILHIEYLKTLQKTNASMTYPNWNKFIDNYPTFYEWKLSCIKSNFNPEVFDAYYAYELAWDMTIGGTVDKSYAQFTKHCSNNKYLSRINSFKDLLENGLRDKDYNLNAGKFALNSLKLDSLLNSYKGRPVYLVIWSAQFAGSTIISTLPSVIDFEKENIGKVEVINICIDKAQHKNLWAARIIDSSWKGNHYFLPAEGNEEVIKKFNAKDIFGFCYDGATYTLINKEGKLINNMDAPIRLSKETLFQ